MGEGLIWIVVWRHLLDHSFGVLMRVLVFEDSEDKWRLGFKLVALGCKARDCIVVDESMLTPYTVGI